MHFKEASQVQVHLGDGQTVQRQCRQSFFNIDTSPFISEVKVPQTDKQLSSADMREKKVVHSVG